MPFKPYSDSSGRPAMLSTWFNQPVLPYTATMPNIATRVGITSDRLNVLSSQCLPGKRGSRDSAIATGIANNTLNAVERKACHILNFITRCIQTSDNTSVKLRCPTCWISAINGNTVADATKSSSAVASPGVMKRLKWY